MSKIAKTIFALFFLATFPVSSFAASCELILAGLLYEDANPMDRSPLYFLNITEILRNDLTLWTQFRMSPPTQGCTRECTIKTGTWKAHYAPKPGSKDGPFLSEAENNQTVSGADPVYGSVTAKIHQTILGSEIPAPDLNDPKELFQDLESSEMFGARDLARKYLNPTTLVHLLDLISSYSLGLKSSNTLVPEYDFRAELQNISKKGDLGQFLAQTGFNKGTSVELVVQKETASSGRIIRLIASNGAEVELSFKKGDASTVETVRTARQVRRALTSLTFTLADGKLAAASQRYEQILGNEIAARLAKAERERLMKEAAKKASSGHYVDRDPKELGLDTPAHKVKVFYIRKDELSITDSAIEFRMADSPRPDVIVIDGLPFVRGYFQSGSLNASLISDSPNVPFLQATYEKTPEEVTLKDGSKAVVIMLDVTWHANPLETLKRVEEIRKGRR